MNRSEKLLEAIGQIDDRLILDAEKAGAAKAGGAAHKAPGKKKSSHKKVTGFRYRSALAACAVLAICVGIYGLLAKEGLMLSPFGGREESSQQTQITADTAMEMAVAEEAAVEEEAVAEEAVAEEAMPAEAAEAPAEAAPADAAAVEGAAVQQRSDDIGSKEGNTDGAAGGGQGTENQASAQSAEEAAGEAKTTESPKTEMEEALAEEGAVTEGTETETAEAESLPETKLAAAEEPMVMSLRPVSGEVSDNDVEQIQELPASRMESKLMKTAGTDVTVRFSNNYTDATVTYGSMYGLERQTQSGWNNVSAKENVAWVDVEYELEAGKSATETVRLESIFGKLEAGHYRLIKNCTVNAADQTKKEIVLYTEFDISKK